MRRSHQTGKWAVLAGLACLASVGAQAAEVRFPKDRPQVSMQVPDNWTVSYTDFGLELSSPEKNSYVVASVVKRAKPAVDAWAKSAVDKLIAFGVTFDVNGQAKTAEAPKKDAPTTAPPKPEIPKSDVANADGAPSKAPTGQGFAFSGTPSLETPAQAPPVVTTSNGVGPAGRTLADLTKSPPSAAPSKLPFKVAQYFGARLGGKPIDVQLINFSLAPTELFMMDQVSTSADDRAVDIVQSVKPAK